MNLEEYQYATMSAYSPTMSELPLKGEAELRIFVYQVSVLNVD